MKILSLTAGAAAMYCGSCLRDNALTAELRRMGFNTVANWSDWRIAQTAGMPYVRPLTPVYEELPCIYRDFPDVFAPEFDAMCAEFGQQLAETRDDPAFIGYFLMNEPTWAFSKMRCCSSSSSRMRASCRLRSVMSVM